MKEFLVRYLRTGEIEEFFNAVRLGLTYDEYLTITSKPVVTSVVRRYTEFNDVCIAQDPRWVYALTPETLGTVLFKITDNYGQETWINQYLVSTFYQSSFIGEESINTLRTLERMLDGMCLKVRVTNTRILFEMEFINQLMDVWEIQTMDEAATLKRMVTLYLSYYTGLERMTYRSEYESTRLIKVKVDEWIKVNKT